jgi:hypothetical protein
MTYTDGLPDRAALQRRAAERQRRGLWIGAGGTAAVVLVASVVAAGVDHRWDAGDVAITAGLAILMAAVIIGVGWLAGRRQPPAALLGADPGTRKAVRQALTDGRSDDARIDALARDSAERSVRLRWLLVLYLIVVPIEVVALVLAVAGHVSGFQLLTNVWILLVLAMSAALVAVARRRAQRYLAAGQPHETGPAGGSPEGA